jgi:hypothetical protein
VIPSRKVFPDRLRIRPVIALIDVCAVPVAGPSTTQFVANAAAGKLPEIGSDIGERAGRGDMPTSHEHEISLYSADLWPHG